MRLRNLLPLAALLAAAPSAAFAFEWFGWAPEVRVDVTGVESQAQLAKTLEGMGYTHVRLSPIYPNPASPYPENSEWWPSRLYRIPVHAGWNGSAEKDGRRVPVWVDIH